MRDAVDYPQTDLREPVALNRVKDALQARGLAGFTGVADRAEALQFAEQLVTITPHRDGDLDGVTTIAHRADAAQQAGFAGFSDRELHPHTEGSALAQPPRVLILICLRPAYAGGYSVLVDGRELYDEIARDEPAMLAALSTPRSAYFGSGYRHLGSVFEPAPDGQITTRLRLDDLIRFSPVVMPYVDRLRHVVDRHTWIFRLAEGEGFALLNDRSLHGRTQFTGDRAMLRILGNPLPALAMSFGFAPTKTGLPVAAA